jgi:prepilin-type N-terminal cleavage/methylation domain-containing protein
MTKSWRPKTFRSFRSSLKAERGYNLIEVLIGLAILALVGGVFLVATTTSSKFVIIGHEQVSAEGLAKSQMESIKQEPYIEIVVPGDQPYTKLAQKPDGYDIDIVVDLLDPQGDASGIDQGLQKIIITVTHLGQTAFILEGYKTFTGE